MFALYPNVKYWTWLSVFVGLSLSSVLSAECTGKVNANMEVTGAFTKVNGSNFQINSNEYATFTCAGNAETGVEVESNLEVSCVGSDKQKIKSSAGSGFVTAKWQSNDYCWFLSSCTLKCSASTDCDKTDVQVYEVNKVINIEKKQVNCSVDVIDECPSNSEIVQTLTRQKPLGNGKFYGTTSCEGYNKPDNYTTSTFVVSAPLEGCECTTTFSYYETTSAGEVCSKPVFVENMDVRNEIHCSDGLSAGMIAFIVLVFVALFSVFFFLALRNKQKKKKISRRPTEEQVCRMTAMDKEKFTALIEAASNSPDRGGSPGTGAKIQPDPVYDVI